MSLASVAVKNRTVTYFALALILVIGTLSYFRLGQLEDPEFTVKTALVVTQYPGASPTEVELEVTDKIETAIQELPELRFLTSYSHAGLSIVKVEIQQEYWADRLPQVWDKVRNKVGDLQGSLPPGAGAPNVIDDFSFVYGFVLAVTGDGFTYAELEEHVKAIRKELSLVQGVSRVETWGLQPKVIYLDASEQRLLDLGVSAQDFLLTLNLQNQVVDSGALTIGDRRLRIAPTGEFQSPEDIGNLQLRPGLTDRVLDVAEGGDIPFQLPVSRDSDVIRLQDIVDIRQGYLEPALTQMRYDGQPAIGLSIANVSGGNIVDTGRNLDAALEEISSRLPVGIEMHQVAWQSDLVTESINSFMVNLLEAVLVVLIVVAVFMGWRMGLIIGSALLLTILATFMVMVVLKIDLQRVSLGALVIALGMMVDNAIVVADGMAARMKKGMGKIEAAIEAAGQPSMALLGATIVAVMAFFPIYASSAAAGEYAGSLFVVVAVSLLISWIIAMTITPLMCIDMLPTPKVETTHTESAFTSGFRAVLGRCLRHRGITAMVFLALLGGAIYGFSYVDRLFFTDATRQQFMVDVWAEEGSTIDQTSELARRVEDKLNGDPRVKGVSTFMGAGGPRFYLPVDPELPYASYAQLVVNTESLEVVNDLVAELDAWIEGAIPEAMTRVRKYTAGPGNTWPFEVRFSGPANADPQVLRNLAEQTMDVLRASPHAKDIRSDMRNRVAKLVPEYDQTTGIWTGTSRNDIASAARFAYDGLPVGLYRENEDLLPIILRRTEDERQTVGRDFAQIQIQPAFSTKSLPLSSVTQGIEIELEDPTIVRWQRQRAVTVQASSDGVTLPSLVDEVRADIEAIKLPPGYRIEWRGETFSTADAQDSLKPGSGPALVIMVFLVVALFNAFRPALVVFTVVPFAMIGITGGLLLFNQPFSFMALLGAMSLVGLMIKNAVVLLDQVSVNLEEGMKPYDALVEATVSRLNPVFLGAATTILGVLPLLQDIFWVAMATTIAAGLTVGTVVTMLMVPVYYALFHGIRPPETKDT
ncbi:MULTISPECIES: efflux RND transporter permease subunit [unclassified Ruegeria]|uniref:efflux RND transporter permease subunit n=1 Tax=unclassified Ruegeria TaxID=2625375 RepID=UPI001AD9BADD|nr:MULTISPECIES: efflux RND transporter permease subunit [unclassified Ruegeria]MBO9410934.1 efflux RND transporter permease subunit [Ruegeria sp. R8_1]MBO9415135.1 efflux RND transporter permease subunit [Ruegeria sp. R8_2]